MNYQLTALEKCICCGADVHIPADASSVRCNYCRTEMSIPRFSKQEKILSEQLSQMQSDTAQTHALIQKYIDSEDGKLLRLYRQAEDAQRGGRFEEAIALYKQLLLQSPQEEAEIHWRIMLCRYGVEYVLERSSETYLPTITRMVVDSILKDENYLTARRLAPDNSIRMYYTQEARRINNILCDYLEINGIEEPYDVFISVKQGDAQGNPTNDSITAMELYHMLDKMGLKVFNSRISLQQYAGFEYEPHIMHALSTAKVMILVTSCEEYMNSPWLKNEWSRFRWLQKNDDSMSRSLITYVIGKDRWNMQELGKIQLIYALTHSDPKSALRTAVEKACRLEKPAEPQGVPNVQGIDPALLAQALAMLQQQQQVPNTPVPSVPITPKPAPTKPTAITPKPAPTKSAVIPPKPAPAKSSTLSEPAEDLPEHVNDSQEVVQIKDPALELALRQQLVKGVTDPITVGDLSRITKLSIYDKGVSDISPLRYCTSLKGLHLWKNKVSDISPLTGLTALKELYLKENRISDISALANLSELTHLDLSDNRIGDISPLNNLTKLTYLNLNINHYALRYMSESGGRRVLRSGNHISDISPLAGMIHLTELDLSGNKIADISPLTNLTELTELDLRWNLQISDISPLSAMTKLTKLYLGGNRILSIDPLKDMTLLTRLALSHNQIVDISALSGMTLLTTLNLEKNQIDNISALTELTSLTELYLDDNRITDISPLAGLTALTSLHLDDNQIVDISPLAELTALHRLYLNRNQIASISPLSGLSKLTNLYLNGNRISDISPLASLTDLEWLALQKNPFSDISPLGNLNELTALYLDSRIPGVGLLSRNSNTPSAKLLSALRARKCSINPDYGRY